MTTLFRSFAITLFALILSCVGLVPAWADDDSPFREECRQFYQQCDAECAARNPDSKSAGYLGCVARCKAEQGACEAAMTYEEAKPWIKDKVDDMKRFFDEFFRDPPTRSQPSPAPKPQSDDNETQSI